MFDPANILLTFLTRTLVIAGLAAASSNSAIASVDELFKVELVEANKVAGFNFPYVLRTPNPPIPAEHPYLVVESNNIGSDDSFEAQIAATMTSAAGSGLGPTVASMLKVPLLVPVFPRSKREWQFYTHALDRDTMLLTEDPRQRLDLQLLKMVEDARRRLKGQNIDVREKFALVGFSASGTFSNRFAFMHPDKLLAVVSGAVNAFPMLPATELDGAPLNYPLGIADIEEISGQQFKEAEWVALPQMIFMGALDDNDAVKFDDAYSTEERKVIFDRVGEDMGIRWRNAQAIYMQQQPNVSFTTYGQVGHWTDGRINGDIVHFVRIMMQRAGKRIGDQ